jgi:hypothetical protein
MKPRARQVTIAAAVAGAALAVLFVTRTEDLSVVLGAFALCSLAGASCSWEAKRFRRDVAGSCGVASVLAILPWIFIMYYWSPFWGAPRKFLEAFIVVSVGLAYGIGRCCLPPLAMMLWRSASSANETSSNASPGGPTS